VCERKPNWALRENLIGLEEKDNQPVLDGLRETTLVIGYAKVVT